MGIGKGLGTPSNEVLVAAFSRDQQKRNLSDRTIVARRSVLRLFASFCGVALLSIGAAEIDAFLESRELQAISRGHYISYLHNFYEWAIREELTDRDPTVRIPKPRRHKHLPRPISEGDLIQAFRMADTRMAAMLALGSYGGLRCMEIAGLRWEDIHWHRDPPLMLVRGKGDKDRLVPLAYRAELALRAHGVGNKGPVFPRQDGGHYQASTVSTMINGFLHSIGVSDTAHALRHKFGTDVYDRSKDLVLTAKLMGHESINTTLGHVGFSATGAEAVRSL